MTIPAGVTSIGEKAFYQATALKELYLQGSGDLTFGTDAMTGVSLNYLDLQRNIGNGLQNQTELSTLILGEAITSFPGKLLGANTVLDSFSIPATVTVIEEGAFKDCTALTYFSVEEGETILEVNKPLGSAISNLSLNRQWTGELFATDPIALTDTYIGNGVSYIPNYSFMGASKLAQVSLPESVGIIGYNAFEDCQALASISMPGVKEIYNGAFRNCSAMTSLSIPANVENVGSGSFAGCQSLTTLTIEDSESTLTTAGNSFVDTPIETLYLGRNVAACLFPTIKSLTIGDKVTSIAKDAFSGSSLASVTIPATVQTIGENAFANNMLLTDVTINDAETEIALARTGLTANATTIYMGRNWTGDPMTKAVNVTTGPAVTAIPANAFYGAGALNSVSLAEGLESIGSEAFSRVNLEEIVLPQSLTTLGYHCFSSSRIGSINIPSGVGALEGISGATITNLRIEDGEQSISGSGGKISVENLYMGRTIDTNVAKFPGLKSLEIGNNVTLIQNEMFANGEFATVTLPEGLTYIGSSAFANCKNLTGIFLPENITVIGSSAFAGCSALSHTNWPSQTTIINRAVFKDCALTQFDIPETVWCIDENAFNGNKLTSLIIPASINGIYGGAFTNNPITELRVEDAEEYIGGSDNPFVDGNNITTLYMGRSWSSLTFPNAATVEFGNKLKWIPADAFKGNSVLTSLRLPASLTQVGSGALNDCPSLTSLYIEDSSETLDFQYKGSNWLCISSVTDLYMGRSWTNANFDNAVNVELSENVTSLPDNAFRNADFSNIDLPAFLQSIGQYAFSGCKNLTSVIVPYGTKTIGGSAFSGCDRLYKLAIPDNLSYNHYLAVKYPADADIVDGWIFNADRSKLLMAPLSISGDFVVPESILTIGDNAFVYCTGLRSVAIPSATSIGRQAFYNTGLQSVVIPPTASTVDATAFNGCRINKGAYPDRLKSPFATTADNNAIVVYPARSTCYRDGYIYSDDYATIYYAPISLEGETVIPNSVKNIAPDAFTLCSGITGVRTENTAPAQIDPRSFTGLYDSAVLKVPDGSLSTYMCTLWSLFGNISDAAGTAAEKFTDDVFTYRVTGESEATLVRAENYASMSNASIPQRVVRAGKFMTVKAIGYNAFDGCVNLEKVALPKNAVSIGENSFRSTGIKSIILTDKIETIGKHAFEGTGITSVKFNAALRSIDESAFSNCLNLASVEFNEALETIGKNAFEKTPLTSVKFNSGLVLIDESAFSNCSALTSVEFNDDLAGIGSKAFYGCNIGSVAIPASTLIVGSYAFAGNSNLATLTLGKGVKEIAPFTFQGCKALRSVEVPDAVTEIGESAFDGATLTKLTLGRGLKTIGAYAFEGCSGLPSVVIPNNVNSIASGAFYGFKGSFIVEDGINPINNLSAGSATYMYLGRNYGKSYRSSSLKSLSVGNLVTELPDKAFEDCSALSELELGSGLASIGASAFANCNLSSIVIPSSVITIGDGAFAGNDFSGITMGCGLTEIGARAFDGSNNIAAVKITALNPPAAHNTTFSYYDCPLYVPQRAYDEELYYNDPSCWYRFEPQPLVEPQLINMERTDGSEATAGKMRVSGENTGISLTAEVLPDYTTVKAIMWSSSNPEVAVVDNNGNVTVVAGSKGSAEITARTLYADGPVASVTVNSDGSLSDVISIGSDIHDANNRPNDIYNMQGILLKRNADADDVKTLSPGIYLIGGKKVLVK